MKRSIVVLFHNNIFLGFILPIIGVFIIKFIKHFIKKNSWRTNIACVISIFLLLGATAFNHAGFTLPIIPIILLLYCLTGIYLAFRAVFKNNDLLLKPFIVLMWRLLVFFAAFSYLICFILWITKLFIK